MANVPINILVYIFVYVALGVCASVMSAYFVILALLCIDL